MGKNIAIIGDNFMLPEMFQEKIISRCGESHNIRMRQDNWPDEPMQHGYAVAGMDGLKEYFGSAEDVVDFISDAEILVTHLAPMSRQMFEELPNLKMIAVSRGGPVNIDMEAAHMHNVRVVNTPGRNASAVAEFTIGAILAETRKIRIGHEALRKGQWLGQLYRADMTGRELNELCVGVVGYGNIGKKVVRLLTAFGCQVLVHDPYQQLSTEDIKNGVQKVSFDDLLMQSDVVTLHARVSEETTHMMNAAAFAKMKKDSIFINTARGPLCNYDDLAIALEGGGIGSAMLETFAIEPPPADWRLLQLENVTLTPHIAGSSLKTVSYAAELVAEEVYRYISGKPANHPC